jgi:hypothetical protein
MNNLQLNSPRRAANLAAAVIAAIAGLLAPTALAQSGNADQPSVTPYRPSVSTPAALSAPGWLEIEAGVLRSRGAGAERRDSVPYTLKLAFTPDWGLRFGGDAWVRQDDGSGQRLSGTGDSSIVLKRRFAIDETSAFGLEAGATLTTGRNGIGSGKSDYSLNAIYSADIGAYHTDLNLASTRIGAVGPGVGRMQTLWAASLSKSINERWGLVGEFSGTRQHGEQATGQFLVACSYNLSKSLTLDAGLARSIRSQVQDRSFFTGLTILGSRLF